MLHIENGLVLWGVVQTFGGLWCRILRTVVCGGVGGLYIHVLWVLSGICSIVVCMVVAYIEYCRVCCYGAHSGRWCASLPHIEDGRVRWGLVVAYIEYGRVCLLWGIFRTVVCLVVVYIEYCRVYMLPIAF